MTNHILTEREAARRLRVSVSLLRKWRRSLGGPPFLKLGAAVRYAERDLGRFVGSCRVTGRRECSERR